MAKRRLFSTSFYKLNLSNYKKEIEKDEYAFSTFKEGLGKLTKRDKHSIEFKVVKLYRLYQANYNTIWRYLIALICHRYIKKYGLDIFSNNNIGSGLVIGHWGRIIINGESIIGNQLMITHGVTIGRDVRGKRRGVPKIGNRVAIRTNSTVVGNITIGDDVVIAPNTFVNFDVPSNSIVIGNPAKIIHKTNAALGHVGKLPD